MILNNDVILILGCVAFSLLLVLIGVVIAKNKEIVTCKTDYPLVPRFEHYTSQQNLHIKNRLFENDGVVWELEISEEEKRAFLLFAGHFERDGFRVL